MVPCPDVPRTLEHQVLEEVREPLAVRLLVTRADVVPEVHRDDTEAGRGADDHAEPVVEGAGGQGVTDVGAHPSNVPAVTLAAPTLPQTSSLPGLAPPRALVVP